MTQDIEIIHNQPEETLSVQPKKFLLWLFIVSVVMLFGGFTSYYLVRLSEGDVPVFEIPEVFRTSTIVLVLSSLSMHFSLISAKKDNFSALKTAICITFALGLVFLYLQIEGWSDLYRQQVYFAGSNSIGSMVYVLSLVHGLHIISALAALVFALIAVFKQEIHAKRLTQLEICTTYWHFLDILWVYLYFFLLYFTNFE
jgi:cytochrome c oxidase subunit III